jgi:hypothetical protein
MFLKRVSHLLSASAGLLLLIDVLLSLVGFRHQQPPPEVSDPETLLDYGDVIKA